MQKNDIIELEITDMGVGGEGIGKAAGATFFVKDAVIGDVITARITKLKKTYGYARLENLIRPSELRCEPRCPQNRRCGGCQIQAMSYEAQLSFKQNKVRGNLIRLGGFAADFVDRIMEPIVGMEKPYRYRNKAQFPIGTDRDGQPIAGFYAARTHSIIPVEDCLLGVEQNRTILDAVLDYMRAEHVPAYDETTGKGLIRHVLIRYGFTSKEIMVALVVNGRHLPHQEALIHRLTQISGMKSISINCNRENTNVILGSETICIWGEPYITDAIHLCDCSDGRFTRTGQAVTFQISPQSFYQVNPVQTEKLYSLALDYAGLTGTESVWDLYCGIGTISLFLAKKAGQVYGVEIVPQAIEDARRNAALNGITNAQFFVGKAEEVLPAFYGGTLSGQEAASDSAEIFLSGEQPPTPEPTAQRTDADMRHPDVIVVDPPRKGCDAACLDTMLKMQPDRIVYVSCDSATLARDLRILCDGGYELRRVRPVDQFGHTVHVETVVLLSHKKPDGHINVKVEFGEGEGKVPLDNIAKRAEEYKPRERVTYKMIKEYIEAKYGFKVHTAYIAEVKRDLGLPMYDAPNAVEELKHPRKHPTVEKVEAIKDALKHFEVI